jgi:hypothetical protein
MIEDLGYSCSVCNGRAWIPVWERGIGGINRLITTVRIGERTFRLGTLFDVLGLLSVGFFYSDLFRIYWWTTTDGLATGHFVAWVDSNVIGEHWWEVALLGFSCIWLLSAGIRIIKRWALD